MMCKLAPAVEPSGLVKGLGLEQEGTRVFYSFSFFTTWRARLFVSSGSQGILARPPLPAAPKQLTNSHNNGKVATGASQTDGKSGETCISQVASETENRNQQRQLHRTKAKIRPPRANLLMQKLPPTPMPPCLQKERDQLWNAVSQRTLLGTLVQLLPRRTLLRGQKLLLLRRRAILLHGLPPAPKVLLQLVTQGHLPQAMLERAHVIGLNLLQAAPLRLPPAPMLGRLPTAPMKGAPPATVFGITINLSNPRGVNWQQMLTVEGLFDQAISRSRAGTFPDEMLNFDPVGYYASTFEQLLAEFNSDPDRAWEIKPHRDFVGRCTDEYQVFEKLFGICFNVKKHGLWGWHQHERNLHRCLEHLPDNWFYGYVPLPEGELYRRFDGDRLECLKTLLRKHKGEVIRLYENDVGLPPAPITANIAVFHPELYTNRDSDEAQQSVSEAVRVRLNEFQAGKKAFG